MGISKYSNFESRPFQSISANLFSHITKNFRGPLFSFEIYLSNLPIAATIQAASHDETIVIQALGYTLLIHNALYLGTFSALKTKHGEILLLG